MIYVGLFFLGILGGIFGCIIFTFYRLYWLNIEKKWKKEFQSSVKEIIKSIDYCLDIILKKDNKKQFNNLVYLREYLFFLLNEKYDGKYKSFEEKNEGDKINTDYKIFFK